MLRSKTAKHLTVIVAFTLLVNAVVPPRVLATYSISPVREAQAQLGGGQGGPMGFVLPLIMMLVMLGAMQNNKLQGPPESRANDAFGNFLNINPNGGGNGVPNGQQPIIIVVQPTPTPVGLNLLNILNGGN